MTLRKRPPLKTAEAQTPNKRVSGYGASHLRPNPRLSARTSDTRQTLYAIEIFYSEEDNGYIAIIPELPGCSAFGETEEKALEEIKMAMELWLETAKKEGRKIPQPHGKELLKILYEDAFRTTRPKLAGV